MLVRCYLWVFINVTDVIVSSFGACQNGGLDMDEAIDMSYALSLAFIYTGLLLLKPLRCWYLAKLVVTLRVNACPL